MRKTILRIIATIVAVGISASRCIAAVALTDIGPNPPTPGANDVSQLSTTGDTGSPGGQNYYSNNGSGTTSPGETFTTSGTAASYSLTDIYVQTGNGSGGISASTGWSVYVYSLSGSTAQLVASYTNLATGVSFNSGDWLHFSGLALALSANHSYAFAVSSGGSAYTGMENSTAALSGAKAVLIETSTDNATVTSISTYNAVFDVGLTPQTVALSQNGSTPVPGANDVSQLSNAGDNNSPDSDSYYSNGHSGSNPLSPGEEFTTPNGSFNLTSVSVQMDSSSGNSIGAFSPWVLNIYSVSGTTGTLIASYDGLVTGVTFTNDSWVEFTGLSVPVSGNTTYAFTVGTEDNRATESGSGPYTSFEDSTANLTGANAVLINANALTGTPTSGTITAITSPTVYNEVFDVGLAQSCTAPSAPAGVTATPGDNQVVVSWEAPSGTVTGYNVLRSATSGSGYTLLPAGSDITATNFDDTTAVNGTTYYYVIEAFDGACESIASSQAGATPCAAPNAPTGLSATAGGNEVTLTWTAPSGSVNSYNVKRSTTSGEEETISNVMTTSLEDTTAVAGATYYYEVSALEGTCESANSSEVSATPCLPPNAPAIQSAVIAANQVTISWSAPGGSPAAAAYNVKRSSVSGEETDLPAGVGVTNTTFTDTTVVNGAPYYYVVSAVSFGGCESYNSAEISVNVSGLSDVGGAPTPGPNDITQFSMTGDSGAPGGKNFYSNNGGGATPPGQTFTTLGGASGWQLTSVAVETGNGSGNGIGPATDYTLYIYSVTNGTATLLSAYQNLTTGIYLNENDWFQFSGLTNILEPGATYAYAISSGSSPYTGLENASGQPYGGGLAALIPSTGGAITTISGFDGVFDIGLIPLCTSPNAPTGVTATPGSGQISLSWTAPSGTVTAYDVERSTTSGSETTIATVTNISYVDMDVSPGTTYYYVVAAVEDTCVGTASTQASASTCVPGNPPTIDSTVGNNGEVTVTWTAPSGTPPAGYNVKRSITSGTETTLSYGMDVTGTTFHDTNVLNGTTYYYVVSALSAGGCESANSGELSTVPCSAPNPPLNPLALIGNNQVTISWTMPAGIVTGYNVYRSTTPGSGYTLLPPGVNVTASPFTDYTAINGTEYYYVVTSLEGNCESADSAQVSASPCDVAQAPTGITATPGDNSVTVSWTPPSSGPTPASYNVKRSSTRGAEVRLPAGANVSGTSFVDTTAVNGAPYYYVVSSLSGAGCESTNSAEVSVDVSMLLDIGQNAPTSGSNDISQLSTIGNQTSPDGVNYYDNDGLGPNTGCGQTFTTGSNPGGYELSSLSIQTGGLGSGNEEGNALAYSLFLYQTNAAAANDFTLIWSNSAVSTLVQDGDWWQWTGLTNVLAPNTTYAWSMYVIYTGYGYYEAMAVSTSVSNGVAVVGLPESGSGTGSEPVTGYSAVYDVGLITLTNQSQPTTLQPGITGVSVSGTNLVMTGTNGVAGEVYTILSATNLALPLSQWIPVATNTFIGSSFSITNAMNRGAPGRFYIIQIP